ncbi:MAG TPA: TrbI/VirB10 family protein [Drouetiella sp.]
MTRGFLPIALSVLLSVGSVPIAFAGDSQLNFKIYSPDGGSSPAASTDEAPASAVTATDKPLAAPESATADTAPTPTETAPTVTESKPELSKEEPAMSTPSATAPATSTTADTETAPAAAPATAADTAATPAESTASTTTTTDTASGDSKSETTASAGGKDEKVLQGYVREVPARTHIPIIMDTAVDSDTSQEGDEFSARTSEDLTIDGTIVVPAGSVIKGRIAQLNAPKHFERGGSVALKFDTVTTPDNRSIPLVANLVAHRGVVHAKRGLKDYAIDSGTVAAPLVVGALIGLVAGKSNSNTTTSSSSSTTSNSGMSKGAAMALGTGIGLAVGVAILCAKKGKKVDVRPGDELKIELAEALRMPMM